MECNVGNTTVKKLERSHPEAWKRMKYAFDDLFDKDDKNVTGSKIDKKWTLKQIEKVERFELKSEEEEKMEKPIMFRIDFKFILSDCRVVSGTVRNEMPCSCCFKWSGFASVTQE